MEVYKIILTPKAKRDLEQIQPGVVRDELNRILENLVVNPFHTPPSYTLLTGEMEGSVSRRLSISQRLVYQVIEAKKVIKVLLIR